MAATDRSAKDGVRLRRMFQKLGDDFSLSFGITGSPGVTTFLRGDLSWSTAVTSVAITMPAEFSVAGTPITTSGTFAITKANQAANIIYAGPSSGAAAAPTFRSMVVDDIPSAIPATKIANGSVSDTEFQYLDGVTSAIQTQLNGKIDDPGTVTDNATVRWDGTGGVTVQNSIVIIDDSGNLSTTGKGTFGAATSGFDIGVSSATLSILNAVGSVTNIPIVLQPKATGALMMQVPDSTSTGGNARGSRAIDLQRVRSAAAQVASGTRSVLISGSGNTASATDACVVAGTSNTASAIRALVCGGTSNTSSAQDATVCGGTSNTASMASDSVFGGASNTASGGNATIVGGGSNIADGDTTTVVGGSSCTATGQFSIVAGGESNTALGLASAALGRFAISRLSQQIGVGLGQRAADGDKMLSIYGLSATTTNATPEELFINGDAGSERLTIPSGKAMMFVVLCCAYTGSASGGAFFRMGGIKNNGGTTGLIGAVVTLGTDQLDVALATATISVTADNANDALAITVTGVAATTIHWVATVIAVEVA